MSAKRQNSDLNNLSESLHSIISGAGLTDAAANIPFADDEDATQIDKTNGKSSDSVSSNESYPEKVNYNSSGRRGTARVPLYTVATSSTEASGESDSDDGRLAAEKRDKPGPLASDVQRVEVSNLGVMRRNSYSMPVLNESDLDALRNLHLKAVESRETMDSKESLSKITVS